MHIDNKEDIKALVVASFGNNYIICTENNNYIEARFKGKTERAVVGDVVDIKITAYTNDEINNNVKKASQASITKIHKRKNLLYRSDANKNKSFASNLDHVLLVVATEPSFNPSLIDRAIIACEIENIPFSIILNKCDINNKLEYAREQLSIYTQLGYEVIELSSVNNSNAITELFDKFKKNNKNCLLIGQSGMGKSSLINSYMPEAKLQIQEISKKLDSGKHTTTHTKLYKFNQNNDKFSNGYLVDSPGFQLFGLHHLSSSQIMHGFKEFKPFFGKCKFHNCIHQHEPQCAILEAYENDEISEQRFESYSELINIF
jgi:ribosome biogenesis GTPase